MWYFLLTIAVGLKVDAASEDAKQAAVDPLVYKAWTFVRSVSGELGEQAQGVLAVQNNLTEFAESYDAELARWQQTSTVLTQQGDALHADLARTQDAGRAQSLAATKVQQLQLSITQAKAALVQVQNSMAQHVAEQVAEETGIQTQKANLNAQLLAARTSATQVATQNFNAERAQKQSVADLESQVYANVNLLQATQSQAVAKSSERAQQQAAAWKENIIAQQANADLEARLLVTTKKALGAQKLEKEEQEFAAETAGAAKQVTTATLGCKKAKDALEQEVSHVQLLGDQRVIQIQACQQHEAELQGLQAKLNSCHPQLR